MRPNKHQNYVENNGIVSILAFKKWYVILGWSSLLISYHEPHQSNPNHFTLFSLQFICPLIYEVFKVVTSFQGFQRKLCMHLEASQA
jgi:hypothetical protein